MNLDPITLRGTRISLVPLTELHLAELTDVGLDPRLWQWNVSPVLTREAMRTYVAEALDQQRQGSALPFVIIENATRRAIGSTRYGNIDRKNRRVEIGWTWVAVQWQRTPVNTEAKYLLLRHAFETLGSIRVEFKTDALNEQSRQALERIGARFEGVLRRHMIAADGRIRDSAYFSILDSEWPEVRTRLEAKLSLPFAFSAP
jgi:RimJ/RimL family protein N-acetyltransferase